VGHFKIKNQSEFHLEGQTSSSWNLFPIFNEVNGGFRNLKGKTVKCKPVKHEREIQNRIYKAI